MTAVRERWLFHALDLSHNTTGNPADAAYEEAGYRKHRGNAARLSANEHVKDRVKEIQAIGAERAAVIVQSLIGKP